ncbi:acyclic terpene utilization AtuA family protein, partial [Clostridium saccharoperbutylacetonicum]
MKSIRIGGGAGYGGDRIEPAVDLIKYGKLDYIIFECLAERTIALGQLQKLSDNKKGYNELLEYRMEKV